MGTYIARRLAWLPVILLIVSFITFVLGRYGPGDPVQVLMGQHTNPQVVERIREQRGLNDNIFVQYGRYLRNVSQGDFGESFKYRGRSVSELLKKKMWVSAQLNIAAMIISVGLGVPIGLYAAMKQGTGWDTVAVAATLVGQSVPIFLTAPGLLLVFALKLDILPTHGWGGFFDTQIILPAVAMGVPGVAIIARLTRASTLDVVSQDYVRTARAKGLPEFTVRNRHILRNALDPRGHYIGIFPGQPGIHVIYRGAIFRNPGRGQPVDRVLFRQRFRCDKCHHHYWHYHVCHGHAGGGPSLSVDGPTHPSEGRLPCRVRPKRS